MPGAQAPEPSAAALLDRNVATGGGPSASTFVSVCRKFVLCLVYIAVSAALIRFNKFMMAPERFPHALALSAGHMITSSFLCVAAYLCAPSMLPAMEGIKGQWLDLLRWFMPIALLFGVNLFGSNQAYLYCSVTFLQFMKEANVVIVFVISCVVGTQTFTRLRVFVILWVVLSASVSVSGEVRFAWQGFVLQAVSQVAECTRNVMGECLLRGKKLDPLTYNMFLAPVCFVLLAAANLVHWDPSTWADFYRCWPLILANGSLAFCLNLLVASVIKECSAVGFVLCGISKDIALVVISAMAFGDTVTAKQAAAFTVTLGGVLFWSFMKTHPDSQLVYIFERMLCSKKADDRLPLLPPTTRAPSADKSV